MNKKLIALAVAGLCSRAFSLETTATTHEVRGHQLDPRGHAILRKECKKKAPHRNTGTAATKRAAKKKRNRK